MAFYAAVLTSEYGGYSFTVVGAATPKEAVDEGSDPGDVNLTDYIEADRGGRTVEWILNSPAVPADEMVDSFRFGMYVYGTNDTNIKVTLRHGTTVLGEQTFNFDYDPPEERVVVFENINMLGSVWNGTSKRIKIETVVGSYPQDPGYDFQKN